MSEERKQSDYQKELVGRVKALVSKLREDSVVSEAVLDFISEELYAFVRAECLQSFKNGKRAGLASSPRPAKVSGTALKNGRLRPVTPDEEQV